MIAKLLVANRGEIARRVMRSAHAMGIRCVAVHSDPDADSPHVREADEAVRLPGTASAETYLRVDVLLDAARATGADAVHPGYGFLSEHAGFARACAEAGLRFVGPPAEVIEAMGSKLTAKAVMSSAAVPVLPTVEIADGPEPARVGDVVAAADVLGWPVLVKAAAGGGGRGMRVVERPDDLVAALSSARREAESAFGDSTVFLEPYVRRPRHVEVQILGDAHGSVVHLFERECSIQRRHQKIVEECPSPGVSPGLRAELGDAAVRAAKAIGYVNAGTVEFLLLPDGSFAFLEVNTRLQVEHPVTEMVTGLDLVRLQLLVADGLPLPDEVLEPVLRGHAVEARLYAEDPTRSWQPSTGRLQRFALGAASGAGIRLDAGVEDGSVVGPYYDPMLAKVIAHAPTRVEAARALAGALESMHIHGLVTNRDLLVRVLRHEEFLAGDIDTGFLERHDPAVLGAPLASPTATRVHAVVAALADQARRRAGGGVLSTMPSGWRNNPSEPQRCSFTGPGGRIDVSYRFDRGGRCTEATVDGDPLDVVVVSCDPDGVVLEIGGVRRPYAVERSWSDDGLRTADRPTAGGGVVWVDGPDGTSALTEIDRFPQPVASLAAGSLVAPLPGTVAGVAVRVGDSVVAGATLVSLEAMKMEHEVQAPTAGTVTEVHVAPGDQVEAGRLLVVVEELLVVVEEARGR